MRSPLDTMILTLLDQRGGEIAGIRDLALLELNIADANYVRRRLAKLTSEGELRVIHDRPGRGRKALIVRERKGGSDA